MATASPITDDWLRTAEIKQILKVGNTRLYQLINSGAFPISRPAGGLLYARRSDVEKFLRDGYPKVPQIEKATLTLQPQNI